MKGEPEGLCMPFQYPVRALRIPVFSPTDSKALSMDFEMACTAPPAHLSRRWVHQGGSVGCLFRGIVWERRICFG